MKIAMIGGRDIDSVGGIEYWMKHLSRHLASRGHEVTVYCESDRDAVRYEDEVKVVSVKAPRNRYLCKIFASWRATRMAMDFGVDLIHYNVWPAFIWHFLAERKGIVTILMGHGFEWKRSKYNVFQRWILRLCEACAARSARHIVLCSQEQTDWYVRRYGCEGKAATIPSAVELPRAASWDLGSACASTLLYMGRISPEKNVDLLIRAFARARASAPPATAASPRLLLAGSLDASSAYGRRILSLVENTEGVTYLGEVFGEEKEHLLCEAILFCLPSSVEGLPVALLEAAARRIPIVASDIPSNREALGDAACWVVPGDEASLGQRLQACFEALSACDGFVQDADTDSAPLVLRRRLAENAEEAHRRVAEGFTWERSTALYDAYIRSL